MPSYLIVGAGVIGAAIAYRLARAGARVTVIEAGEPAGETTGRSFAWLNSNNKPPIAYHRLNAAGMDAHARLRADLGRGPWLHETGNLVVAVDAEVGARGGPGAAGLADHVAHLRDLGYPAELIDARRAAALEPRVRFDRARAIAFFPGEGWVHGPTLVQTLLDAARECGAEIRTRTRVEAIELAADRAAVRVRSLPADVAAWPRRAAGESPVTADREGSEATLTADFLVGAAGRFSDRLAALAGVEVPLAPTCGLLAVTTPIADAPTRVVHFSDVQFRPEPGGRLLLQSEATDHRMSPETPETPDLPTCAELLERARQYVPALAGARIEGARVGIRPLPADTYPIAGPIPGRDRFYLVVTHSGITLGPLLGEIAAAELLGGSPDPRLADFRPGRIVKTR